MVTEFKNVNAYTGVVVGLGNAFVHWVTVSSLYNKDVTQIPFPETLTRAKYNALEIQEEFEKLYLLPSPAA
jgi:hypothetical protein